MGVRRLKCFLFDYLASSQKWYKVLILVKGKWKVVSECDILNVTISYITLGDPVTGPKFPRCAIDRF